MDVSSEMDAEEIGKRARRASLQLQGLSADAKSIALNCIHNALDEHRDAVLSANALDLTNAEADKDTLSQSLVKRLSLTGQGKFEALLENVRSVDKLPDPVGRVSLATRIGKGLELYRESCPIGVLLVIFEARPEVLVQISVLAIKSGNSVILKGGREAEHSLRALFDALQQGLKQQTHVPKDAIQLLIGREHIMPLLKLGKYIDLVIPRGSNSLVKHIQESTRIPVLGHADGLCSIFVDEKVVNLQQAVDIIVDSKTNYPAACNSVETLLIHETVVREMMPVLIPTLLSKDVKLRCDDKGYSIVNELGLITDRIVLATEEDYCTEFVDLILAIKVVDSCDEAIQHINSHGSKHTDVILTSNEANAEEFMKRVDTAGVFWNASTRFADGFRYGFGAEIGVSTNKTHARGPVGLEGLLIYKYKMFGSGETVGKYNPEQYLHQSIEPSNFHSHMRQ